MMTDRYVAALDSLARHAGLDPKKGFAPIDSALVPRYTGYMETKLVTLEELRACADCIAADHNADESSASCAACYQRYGLLSVVHCKAHEAHGWADVAMPVTAYRDDTGRVYSREELDAAPGSLLTVSVTA